MAWRVVIQPNGKYARFSDVVDDFTDYDLTGQEAFELCRDIAGDDVARRKIELARENPQRFTDALEKIAAVHGVGAAMAREQELSR